MKGHRVKGRASWSSPLALWHRACDEGKRACQKMHSDQELSLDLDKSALRQGWGLATQYPGHNHVIFHPIFDLFCVF